MKHIFIFSDSQKDTISYFELEPAILVSMDRRDFPYFKEKDFSNFSAVYVLIGGNKRYIGQATGQTIAQRLSQHFSNEDKSWVESVIFFSRTDGKMSKADTDYLEKKLIQDFKDKSEYELDNVTKGNTSYIDRLQKAKADQLYDSVFKIIDEIANIDLFGTTEELIDDDEINYNENKFEIEFNGEKLSSRSARGLFVDFVKLVIKDEKYYQKIEEIVIDDIPTPSMVLGRKPRRDSQRSVQVANDIWLYTNFSRKVTKDKINKFADQMEIQIRLKWNAK